MAVATNLKKKNNELVEELELLHSVISAGKGGRPGDGRLQLEIAELKKQLRNEMREKIETRAEFRKAKVEIDKPQ